MRVTQTALLLTLALMTSAATTRAFALDCGDEGSLRSNNSTKATTIKFVNESNQKVTVYWLNYQGERVFYKTVRPNKSYVQQTFATHPWVVASEDDECVLVAIGRGHGQTVTIEGD